MSDYRQAGHVLVAGMSDRAFLIHAAKVYLSEFRMNPITQRLADWRRERQIASLSADTKRCERDGCLSVARMCFREMTDAIARRSPEQVARMERRQGLR